MVIRWFNKYQRVFWVKIWFRQFTQDDEEDRKSIAERGFFRKKKTDLLHMSKKSCNFAGKIEINSIMPTSSTIQRIQTMGKQILPEGSDLWLYGSRARGDNRPDSDWDLIVLVDKDKQQIQDFDAYAYPFIELGWETGVEINPMLYTKNEWEQRHFTPFYM